MENRKLNEGLELIRQAEKYLKTSFLKWKPDYELAAQAYSEAATCFKNAKAHAQCQEAFLKAADCHKGAKSFFSAAKCVDQAIAIAKDLKQFNSIPDLVYKACNLYLEHGSPDTAAASLDKAAKFIANELPEEALKLYIRAADVVDNEDRPRDAAEFIGKAAKAMVIMKRYDDAAKAILREMGHHQAGGNTPAIGRCTVALVLVHIAREDFVEAKKVFEEWAGTCDREEVITLSQLIQGYEEEDPDMVKQGLASSFIRSMDVAYSKLARDLPLPKVLEPVAKPKTKAEPSTLMLESVTKMEVRKEEGNDTGDDEDDELGRLEAKLGNKNIADTPEVSTKEPVVDEEEEDEEDLK